MLLHDSSQSIRTQIDQIPIGLFCSCFCFRRRIKSRSACSRKPSTKKKRRCYNFQDFKRASPRHGHASLGGQVAPPGKVEVLQIRGFQTRASVEVLQIPGFQTRVPATRSRITTICIFNTCLAKKNCSSPGTLPFSLQVRQAGCSRSNSCVATYALLFDLKT